MGMHMESALYGCKLPYFKRLWLYMWIFTVLDMNSLFLRCIIWMNSSAVLCNGFHPAFFIYGKSSLLHNTYVPVLVERNFPISKKGKSPQPGISLGFGKVRLQTSLLPASGFSMCIAWWLFNLSGNLVFYFPSKLCSWRPSLRQVLSCPYLQNSSEDLKCKDFHLPVTPFLWYTLNNPVVNKSGFSLPNLCHYVWDVFWGVLPFFFPHK